MLPQYEVLELIGRGGMGAIYKARQNSLKRLVAIKVLSVGMVDDDMHFVGRFKNEAFAMARLNHPGIVNVHDAGEVGGGLLYFVMEHVEGRDLAQEIAQRGRLPQAEVKAVAAQVCEALTYAHSNGIVHRDIKPANVLLDTQGRAKVADFGLAKLEEPMVSALLTKSGTSMGTADFMAPETKKPGAVVDARADLFSLGVTVYQMLTGELPQGMFKLPSELLPELDPRWDEIICKALEPKPEERYQTATEMRGDLDAVLLKAPEISLPTPGTTRAARSGKTSRTLTSAKRAIGFVVVTALCASFFLIVKKNQSAPEMPDAEWIDWLGPKLADAKNYQDGGWVREEGGLSTDREIAGTSISALTIADAAVRVSYRLRDSGGVQITTRERGMGGPRELYLAHDTGKSIYIARMSPEGKIRNLVNKAYPPEVSREGEHTLEFRCVGNSLTATLNGILTVTAEDAALKDGAWAIVLKRRALVKKVGVLILNRPQAEPSAATASALAATKEPPVSMDGEEPLAATLRRLGVQWQDVSEEARSKAGAVAELVVENNLIRRRSATGPSVRLPLTPESWRDYAIRITHIGDTQIDVRCTREGFYFVLCQAHQTILRKQPAGVLPGERLLPNQLHQPGFDIHQPHELLVMVQGDRLLAWLDGRLVGDVRDRTYGKGIGAVMFVPQTKLQKVEIAKLAGESPDP